MLTKIAFAEGESVEEVKNMKRSYANCLLSVSVNGDWEQSAWPPH